MDDDKEEQQAVKNNPLLDSSDETQDQASEQVMYKPRTGRGKKVGIFLLVIVLIAGAAGGVYFWQQQQAKKQAAELQSQINDLKTQVAVAEKKAKEVESTNTDETKDWKSYTMKVEKLNIKYPSSWKIDEAKSGTSDGVEDSVYLTKQDGQYIFLVHIIVYSDKSSSGLNQSVGQSNWIVGDTMTFNSKKAYLLEEKPYNGSYLSSCTDKKCLVHAKNTSGVIDAYSGHGAFNAQTATEYDKNSTGAKEAITILKNISY